MVINVQTKEDMKKTYKNPTLEVIKIQTQLMLASSPGAHVLDPDTPSIDDSNDIGVREDEDFEW